MTWAELHEICKFCIAKYPDKNHQLRNYVRAVTHNVMTWRMAEGQPSLGSEDDPNFELPAKIALRGEKLLKMMEVDGHVQNTNGKRDSSANNSAAGSRTIRRKV